MKKITLLDTTLRDGAQREGISLSVEDSLLIALQLDGIGIDIIENGSPMFNPKNADFFKRIGKTGLKSSRTAVFGTTCRKGTAADRDENLRALVSSNAQTAVIFGKASYFHVANVLETTGEENLRMLRDSVEFLKRSGMEVIFDAEHFFDGYKYDRAYAIKSLEAAAKAGSDCIVLCDTNGGSLPDEIYKIVREVCELLPDANIGIHCHDDCAMAVANTVAAVRAGAEHVQGTFLGIGERCGNASLCSVIPILQLKLGYCLIPEEKLCNLTETANAVAEICNMHLRPETPFVGRSAFAHKAGTHAHGVLLNSTSFEHIDPERVGNERRILLSEQTGRAAVLYKIHKLAPWLDRDSGQLAAILEKLKELEGRGYKFESAEASFELMVMRMLGMISPFFELVSYKILDEQPSDTEHCATATIKIKVGGRLQISAAEGDGPVNALDLALREALAIFYPTLSGMRLVDYKVRVIDSGKATAAQVRVLITSADDKRSWTTVGAGHDVIESSWKALVDSIEYKLLERN